jgi:hypothetical protein
MARATMLPSRARTSSRYSHSCGVPLLYLALKLMMHMLSQTLGFKSGVCTTGNSLDHCDMVRAYCQCAALCPSRRFRLIDCLHHITHANRMTS